MKQLLRDSLAQIISGVVVAAILATIGVLGLDSQYKEFAGKALIVAWYLILWIGVLFVFLAKRPSQFESSVNLPRFSKIIRVIAGSVIVIATFLLAWSFIPFTIPPLTIELTNNQDYDIGIIPQADMLIDWNAPLSEYTPLATGQIQLSTSKSGNTSNELIVIPAKSKVVVYAQLLHPNQFQKYWEKEYIFASVTFRDKQGQILGWSGAVPFNKDTFTRYIIPVEVPQK